MSPSTTIQRLIVPAAAIALLGSGCTSVTNTSLRPVPPAGGPVQLSPDLQPLDERGIFSGQTDEPVPIYGYTPPRRIRSRRPTIERMPEIVVPQAPPQSDQFALPTVPETNPSPPRLTVPELDEPKPEPVLPAEPLKLTVTVGAQAQVGNGATFEIVARNPGKRAVENVVIEAEFDDALVFPGSSEKKIRRELGAIAAGESRDFAVMLTSETTGRHCARFTLYVDGREQAWKEVCVEYVDNELEVSLLGPARRTVGNRAEFTVTLNNRGDRELTDVQLAVSYDPALEPREGSIGAIFEEHRMRWNLGAIQPGEFVQVQVEFECLSAIEKTCLMVDVASRELPEQRKAQCLRVDAQRGLLQVDLSDERDPLATGETTGHVVTIRNRSPIAVEGLRLTAHVPAALSVLATTVRLDDQVLDVATANEGDRVVFDAIKSLPAGATLTYHLKTKALDEGDAVFKIHLRHETDPATVELSEPISVNGR